MIVSWVFAAAKPADAKAAETARQFLAARTSLGWTDLDRTFASALKQCGPKTQVIYVGDGIVTAGDGDPAAFAKRLRRMVDERTHHAPRDAGASQGPHAEREEYGTFHAVATGNSFEPTVMRAIASIGGGSMRQINASGPKAAALDLLHEIAEPGLRDVKVEFHGLRTARVYPDPLPNLATGTQQIILGRYRPEGKEQTGEVIVTGTQDGKPVRFTAPVTLPSASAGEGTLGGPQGKTDCQSVLRTEGTLLPSASGRGAGGEGSSFIPRLWARMHLDALLCKGTRRRSVRRSSPCRKRITSSRPTRRSWCWRAMPTASDSRSEAGSACATASGILPRGAASPTGSWPKSR